MTPVLDASVDFIILFPLLSTLKDQMNATENHLSCHFAEVFSCASSPALRKSQVSFVVVCRKISEFLFSLLRILSHLSFVAHIFASAMQHNLVVSSSSVIKGGLFSLAKSTESHRLLLVLVWLQSSTVFPSSKLMSYL